MGFLLAALIATKVIKAGIGISASERQRKAFMQEGQMEADLYGKSADLADKQAEDALARGQEAMVQQRARMRSLSGAQTAATGASGIVAGSGTAGLAADSDFALGDMDARTLETNAAREALGFTQQADIYRGQGELARRAGRNRASAQRWQTWSTVANFAGDMFELYNAGKGTGSMRAGAGDYGASSYGSKGMLG